MVARGVDERDLAPLRRIEVASAAGKQHRAEAQDGVQRCQKFVTHRRQ
jgi:hypothetical protein